MVRLAKIDQSRFPESLITGSCDAILDLNLPQLKQVNFGQTSCAGTLPSLIEAQSSRMKFFYAVSCKISGTLPYVPLPADLQVLGLSDNTILGTIHDNYAQFKSLEYLVFGNMFLSGSIPASSNGFRSLETLSLTRIVFRGH